MNAIQKLPGMRSGSSIKLFAVGSLYILLLLCVVIVILGSIVDADNDDEPEVAAVTETPEPETPVITDELIDDAIAFIEDEPHVRDATISVSDDTVTMAVIVDHATNEETARDILDSFVRYLASQTAMHYDIDSPQADSLGELWDHYTLQVGAGPSPDEFYARGAKVPSSPVISWDSS